MFIHNALVRFGSLKILGGDDIKVTRNNPSNETECYLVMQHKTLTFFSTNNKQYENPRQKRVYRIRLQR